MRSKAKRSHKILFFRHTASYFTLFDKSVEKNNAAGLKTTYVAADEELLNVTGREREKSSLSKWLSNHIFFF